MSRHDDPSNDMTRFPSSADADRLLSGHLSPDDLPDEAAPLARLLRGLEPGWAVDPFSERRVVSLMVAEILRGAPETAPSLLGSRSTRLSAKAGVLAFAAVLATGTAAAAATGSLPAGIQRAVSDALSHVSISVPRPASHSNQPVEPNNGGTGGPHSGGSPGGATGGVTPRGVQRGKDDDKTPRGVTNTPTGPTGPTGNNGRHVGPPSSVPKGPGTTNPNKGPGNNSGQHTGDEQGKHKGDANGKKTGQSTVTTTTVKKNSGPGSSHGNAGGNGN